MPRSRRRRLRNKAKTLLEEDTSQENEENYARRLMQVERNSVSSLSKHGGGGSGGSGGGGGGLCGEYTQMWELRRSQPLATHTVINADSGLDPAPCGGSLAGTGALPSACCPNVKTTFSTFKPSSECPYERPHLVAMEAMLAAQNADHVPYYFEYDPPREGPDQQAEGNRADGTSTKRPDLLSSSNRKPAEGAAAKASGSKPENGSLRRVPGQKSSNNMRDLCDHCAMHPCIDKVIDETSITSQAQSL